MALFGRPSQEDDQRAAAWRDWLAQRNVLSIVSFVLGMSSVVEMGVLLLPSVAGIVTGLVALRQLHRAGDGTAPSRPRGHVLASVGIILSAVTLLLALYLYSRGR